MFQLKLLSWNARGLVHNLDQLKNCLAYIEDTPNVMAIQETHIPQAQEIDDPLLQIPGYTLVANKRADRKGGGTAFYIKNSIPYKIIDPFLADIEYSEIQIMLEDCRTPLRLISIYLPPNKKIDEEKLTNLGLDRNTIMVGDFNAKSPIWGSSIRDVRGKAIERCLLDNTELVCVNTGEPTHITAKGVQSHLDLTFCSSNLAIVTDWKVFKDNMGSDHYPTLTTVDKNIVAFPYIKSSWNISKADWNDFTEYLNSKYPELGMLNFDRNRFSEFAKFIMSAAKDNIPVTSFNSEDPKRLRLPYWNKSCNDAIAQRKLAEKIMKKNRTFANIFKYQDAKSNVQRILNEAKSLFWQAYVSTLSSDSKVGSVWRAIKTLSGKYSNRNIPIKALGNPILTDLDKANIFAKEFSHVSSNDNLPPNYKEVRNNRLLPRIS